METNHRTFKPFDKVLVRDEFIDNNKWSVDFYSHYSLHTHVCIGLDGVGNEDILPYEGNEHLVGTNNEPETEVRLKEGEYCFFCNDVEAETELWNFYKYKSINKEGFYVIGNDFEYAIRFSDFNPNDMEETKKHILCVKNGKIIRYKG